MASPVDCEGFEPSGLLEQLPTARKMTSVGHWPPTDRDGLVRHRGENSRCARGGSAHRIPERLHMPTLLSSSDHLLPIKCAFIASQRRFRNSLKAASDSIESE